MSKEKPDMIMWFGAARNGGLADIESGLARGVKVNALCSWRHGRTALWLASSGGHASVVTRLIEANANVNLHDIGLDDNTPLHAAVYNGHAEVLQILIKAGAAPHVKNANGKTARDLAATKFAANGNNVSAQAREAVLALHAPLATVGDPAVCDGPIEGVFPACSPGVACSSGGASALARARASRQQASADQDASEAHDGHDREIHPFLPSGTATSPHTSSSTPPPPPPAHPYPYPCTPPHSSRAGVRRELQDAQADTPEAAAAAEAKVLAAAAAAAAAARVFRV